MIDAVECRTALHYSQDVEVRRNDLSLTYLSLGTPSTIIESWQSDCSLYFNEADDLFQKSPCYVEWQIFDRYLAPADRSTYMSSVTILCIGVFY